MAVAGPDKELTFPVQSTFLDGSMSSDDVGIVYYHWEKIRYFVWVGEPTWACSGQNPVGDLPMC